MNPTPASSIMRLLFATTNPHKIEEVRAAMAPVGIDIVGLHELHLAATIPEPEETGETFQENARIKAIAYARATGELTLAEDSGLEVDALGGRPGVYSARYAGTGITRAERDRANNEKLLRGLRDVPDDRRTARFICAMCLAAADGSILAEVRGTFEGIIFREPRGRHGFGYDPLLFLPDAGRTSAELSPAEKNARSHRGMAARRMADAIREMDLPG
jgi:XTP/dITP diphosphohydrolase